MAIRDEYSRIFLMRKSIYFEKTEGLTSPIEYLDLKACPELEKMEIFVQPNGSLFKLTKENTYRSLILLIMLFKTSRYKLRTPVFSR